METKIVPLNPVPDHPKYLRLPSLSRSLVHNILPKDCHAMYTNPVIFSISVKPQSPEGPPKLSTRSRKPTKPMNGLARKPLMVRPNSPSYIYKKMFMPKEDPIPIRNKYYKSHRASRKSIESKINYFCEIMPDSRGSSTPHPEKHLFSGPMNSTSYPTPGSIKRYYRKEADSKRTLMKNISEARPSQESSTESISYFHTKQVSV